jgi:hypothetical protein
MISFIRSVLRKKREALKTTKLGETMYELDTDFAPEPWLGLSLLEWIVLGLGTVLFWSVTGMIMWRMFG